MEGWIKLHRKIEKHWIWSNSVFIKAWLYCLFRANYADNKVLIGASIEKVEPGSFVTSIDKFSKATGLTSKQTRRFWALLAADSMVVLNTTSKRTKITVCNYVGYQVIGQSERQTKGKQRANKGQTKGNGEEVKEIEEEKKPPKSPRGDLDQMELFPVPKELDTQKFRSVWFNEWIPYRAEQKYRNPGYRPRGLKSALTGLKNMSEGNVTTAIKIIRHSIQQNYQGLFPVGSNGKPKTNNGVSRSREQTNIPKKKYSKIKNREI